MQLLCPSVLVTISCHYKIRAYELPYYGEHVQARTIGTKTRSVNEIACLVYLLRVQNSLPR